MENPRRWVLVPICAVGAPVLVAFLCVQLWGLAERLCGEPISSRSCLTERIPGAFEFAFTVTPALMAIAAISASYWAAPAYRLQVMAVVLLVGTAVTFSLTGADSFAIASIGPGLGMTVLLRWRERRRTLGLGRAAG